MSHGALLLSRDGYPLLNIDETACVFLRQIYISGGYFGKIDISLGLEEYPKHSIGVVAIPTSHLFNRTNIPTIYYDKNDYTYDKVLRVDNLAGGYSDVSWSDMIVYVFSSSRISNA